jgi:hypothetical protein
MLWLTDAAQRPPECRVRFGRRPSATANRLVLITPVKGENDMIDQAISEVRAGIAFAGS